MAAEAQSNLKVQFEIQYNIMKEINLPVMMKNSPHCPHITTTKCASVVCTKVTICTTSCIIMIPAMIAFNLINYAGANILAKSDICFINSKFIASDEIGYIIREPL